MEDEQQHSPPHRRVAFVARLSSLAGGLIGRRGLRAAAVAQQAPVGAVELNDFAGRCSSSLHRKTISSGGASTASGVSSIDAGTPTASIGGPL